VDQPDKPHYLGLKATTARFLDDADARASPVLVTKWGHEPAAIIPYRMDQIIDPGLIIGSRMDRLASNAPS
jgi:hypothetical protein